MKLSRVVDAEVAQGDILKTYPPPTWKKGSEKAVYRTFFRCLRL